MNIESMKAAAMAATPGPDLRSVVEALQHRLIEAAQRHTKDISAEDCLLYAEASEALGQLVDAIDAQDAAIRSAASLKT